METRCHSAGTKVIRSEQPPAQYLADVDTSDEDSLRALGAACRPSERRGWPRSERQRPAAGEPAAADIEEDTLKRKLEELTSNVSDPGASSEEEGKDQGAELDRSTPVEDFPRAASEVRPPQQSWKDKGQQPHPWWARRAPDEGHTGCQTPADRLADRFGE